MQHLIRYSPRFITSICCWCVLQQVVELAVWLTACRTTCCTTNQQEIEVIRVCGYVTWICQRTRKTVIQVAPKSVKSLNCRLASKILVKNENETEWKEVEIRLLAMGAVKKHRLAATAQGLWSHLGAAVSSPDLHTRTQRGMCLKTYRVIKSRTISRHRVWS